MSKRSYHELTDSETVKTGKVPLEPNEHCEQETTAPWHRYNTEQDRKLIT